MLNARVIDAYSSGFSVIEITRAIGAASVGFIHKLLRNSGYINVMRSDKFRRSNSVDPAIVRALKQKGYSFDLWCYGWKFEPESAEIELKSPPVGDNACKVHDALRRDFPAVYARCFKEKYKHKAREKTSRQRFNLVTEWDGTRKEFVGHVSEFPFLEARGDDWVETAFNMQAICWKYECIEKLDHLIVSASGMQ